MSRRRWAYLGLALAALASLIGVTGISHGSFSARGYVADHFRRIPTYDAGREATAYSSPRPPQQVADELTGAWRPAARYSDGGVVYLRYSRDTVLVRPSGAGSLILVVSLSSGAWSGLRGETNRGGGPGAGR